MRNSVKRKNEGEDEKRRTEQDGEERKQRWFSKQRWEHKGAPGCDVVRKLQANSDGSMSDVWPGVNERGKQSLRWHGGGLQPRRGRPDTPVLQLHGWRPSSLLIDSSPEGSREAEHEPVIWQTHRLVHQRTFTFLNGKHCIHVETLVYTQGRPLMETGTMALRSGASADQSRRRVRLCLN